MAGGRRSVLGIDAAWTLKNPSGFALAVEQRNEWRLVAVAPSEAHFVALASPGQEPPQKPTGGAIQTNNVLNAAHALGGLTVCAVAVDMPMAHSPITSRRVSDNAVGFSYGGRWCGTHTPSVERPGPISDTLRRSFEEAGYPLRTIEAEPTGLFEVYPHPALVELSKAERRLPYKASKVRSYWPTETPVGRKRLLLAEWRRIVDLLDCRISGVRTLLGVPPPDASIVSLKSFEDQLDAVVCAWVAIEILSGRALPFGDSDSAIWIPAPVVETVG
jgi:predicted RNase H-like nuclease